MKFNSDKDQIQFFDDDADNVVGIIRNITKSGIQEDAFYIFEVNDIIQKYENWKHKLPRVIPHYAVKCNDHLHVLRVLASLGVGFDCASKEEIRKVLSLGVEPSRIIFANPAKFQSHIKYACDKGLQMMTFDNEEELHKIKSLHPSAKLFLRIRTDAVVAQCSLGEKFGCNTITEAPNLLEIAHKLNLDVVGISFHVGSGCGDPDAYWQAIAAAHSLFKCGQTLGFNMQILDIGGGFPGNKETSIDTVFKEASGDFFNFSPGNTVQIAEVINNGLNEYFPAECGVKIVAEPGRYFVASAFTLATLVHSKREVKSPESGGIITNMYYINDGVYGSFNTVLTDHSVLDPKPLSEIGFEDQTSQCSIWGPTCDSIDKIVELSNFPALNIGDWIIFENMGAYTIAVSTSFNGYSAPKICTILNKSTLLSIKADFQSMLDGEPKT